MSRISSMAREKGLVVRGTGYVSPLQPFTSGASHHAATRTTVIRRAGSVGCLSGGRSGGAAKSTRAPFLPAGRGSGSSGASSRKSTMWQTNGSTVSNAAHCSNDSSSSICKCQHPADISFLEDLYVQNLQTQIEVLEMENTYLRNAGPAVGDYRPTAAPLRARPPPPKSILVRANEDVTVEKQPEPTPRRPSLTRKRVEFADAAEFVDAAAGPDESPPNERSDARSNEETRHTESVRPDFQIHHPHQHQQRQSHDDEDLFERLEHAIQNEVALDQHLNANALEIRKLRTARANADANFRAAQTEWAHERRSLLEDNVELQRRLDELTPLLAEKEARLARLEDELERAVARVRQAETRTASFHTRLEDQKREGLLLSELDSDRRLELERLRDQIHKLEAELSDVRRSETSAKDELSRLNQTISERDAALADQRAAGQRLTAEKSALGTQLAELTVRIQRLDAESSERDRVAEEARRAEADARAELRALDERQCQRAEAYRALKSRLRDQTAAVESHRQARHRITKELEALRALSQSLTEENRGLREERIAVDERVLTLQNKVFAKERDVANLTERLDEFKRKYNEAVERLGAEISRQHDTSEELEEIVKHVHELSTFIPHRVDAAPAGGPNAIVIEFPHSSAGGVNMSDASESTATDLLPDALSSAQRLRLLKHQRRSGTRNTSAATAFSIDSAVNGARISEAASTYIVSRRHRRASYHDNVSESSESSAGKSPKATAATTVAALPDTPTPTASPTSPPAPHRSTLASIDDSLAQRYRKKVS